jgi:glycosyltransferase involved in cell wall biosynthesis
MTLKIGIVDIIGLDYDGTTLDNFGIGGTESAIISLSRQLSNLGFSVTVLNDCNSNRAKSGLYDNVIYAPISSLRYIDYNFDIVISVRNIIPFTPVDLHHQVKQPAPRDWPVEIFQQLNKDTQLKIVWLHDTFCWGDHLLEKLLVEGYINEIFTLSDWHTSYVTHSTHGPRRNIEVLKKYIFQTRNAINKWTDWVDIRQKDPMLFVYNASVTKGMQPLLEKVWPRIQERLPDARLTVIGGYYNFNDQPTNSAEETVLRLKNLYNGDNRVTFTGIITQKEISHILSKASFMIYPAAFPETFGISTLESIYHNVPLLTCKFGALEETAATSTSYFIDYAIEPNSLFPNINSDQQIDKFVNMVISAASNRYLHQQKQYACNIIKEVATWDTVALQWKQHFYNKFNLELDPVEKAKVDHINTRVHQIFQRRFSNLEEVPTVVKPDQVYQLPRRNTKIAIIDIPGMSYDGATLSKRGLGGSESAVILISKHLVNIGFNVTVFNGCNEDDSTPGTYDGVRYRPISDLEHVDTVFDVVISSRTVMPFVTEPFYNLRLTTARQYNYDMFKHIRETAKLKVFWMHDTFSWGDDTIEDLVLSGAVDEIWCLSDFQYHYVMNCKHGKPRNYEVLRQHMWMTRNGIVKYFDQPDIKNKDPNLFIFNANLSKGLAALLDRVWPRIQQEIPEAKLKVVGGIYKLGKAFGEPSSQQSEFDKIVDPHRNNPSIEFTGVVDQETVAKIAESATYFIYPASLPETYGISTMESLYAGTPLLTCRFGALEETATDSSYYIDYAIEPNGLYPHINGAEQVEKFVKMVVEAHRNKNLLKEKQYATQDLADLVGWDVVALEWKVHINKKLNLYTSPTEYNLYRYNTAKYSKKTGRRIFNPEFWAEPKRVNQRQILVVSPFYNAEKYLEQCILSVAQQDYDNYEHWLINDCSSDSSLAKVQETINRLPAEIRSKFKIINNNTNVGAVANQINFINLYRTYPDTIIMLLDGDDCLVNRNDLFNMYNRIHDTYDYTYGSSWSIADNIPLISQPYPPEVKSQKLYKNYRFNWNMPYTHLRTFKIKLAHGIPESLFKDADGNWLRAGGDNATFYNILERAHPDKIGVISDIVYNYNDLNPLNDYKVNRDQQNQTAEAVLKAEKGKIISTKLNTHPSKTGVKRILIAIPTNRNIEAQTFKSIYDLEIPEGYQVDFQYFWGYQVEQVRNLIAHWVIKNNYDYLFSVDSDIAFTRDTLRKLLEHDVDMVSGVYIQRIQGKHTIEIMRANAHGGVSHVPYQEVKGHGLVPIDGCGFGCVLIKRSVFEVIAYPHFVYKSAIDHAHTISEDVYFCRQARDKGVQIYADMSVLCDHIGSWTFRVE